MSAQPKALLPADCLDGNAKTPWKREEAAAELRRLHTQRDELLEALKLADALLRGANMNRAAVEKKVFAAIAKAEGSTP